MQKRSKQRDAVYKAVFETKKHPTAAEVYKEVRKTIPNVSLGTVYRNLATLSEDGKIAFFTTEDGIMHYDAMVEKHHHFVCKKCGRVYDISTPLKIDTSAVEDGEIEKFSVILYGICKNCKK